MLKKFGLKRSMEKFAKAAQVSSERSFCGRSSEMRSFFRSHAKWISNEDRDNCDAWIRMIANRKIKRETYSKCGSRTALLSQHPKINRGRLHLWVLNLFLWLTFRATFQSPQTHTRWAILNLSTSCRVLHSSSLSFMIRSPFPINGQHDEVRFPVVCAD